MYIQSFQRNDLLTSLLDMSKEKKAGKIVGTIDDGIGLSSVVQNNAQLRGTLLEDCSYMHPGCLRV